MEIIYTDFEKKEIGYLGSLTEIDFEFNITKSEDDVTNDFTITIPNDLWDKKLDVGSIVYEDTENSEVGGLIIGKSNDTATNKLVFYGKTWRGLLADKVIMPPSNQAYYQARGDANLFINDIIGNRFDGLITGSTELCNVNVYRDLRFQKLLYGIEKTLNDKQLVMNIVFDRVNMKAIVTAIPVTVREDVEFSQDYGFNFIAKDVKDGFNHCICLGKGELLDRLIINLYKLSNGEITQDEQSAIADGITGINKRSITYENTSYENEQDLIDGGIDKLNDNSDTKKLEISNVFGVNLGDIVGARDRITDIYMQAQIKQKIISGNIKRAKIDYKVGD